jgi:hypothetical protein
VNVNWGSGVRSFTAHDHPHPVWPPGCGEVTEQAGQLSNIRAFAWAAVGVDRLRPGRFGQGEDRVWTVVVMVNSTENSRSTPV